MKLTEAELKRWQAQTAQSEKAQQDLIARGSSKVQGVRTPAASNPRRGSLASPRRVR